MTPEEIHAMPEREFLRLPPTFADPGLNRAYADRLGVITGPARLMAVPEDPFSESAVPRRPAADTSESRRAEAVPFSKITRERVEWLVPGRIPYGAVTLLAGDPGLGKSLYTIAIAADLSRREGSVLFLTAEDSLSATVKPRLEAAGANLERVATVRLRRHGIEEGLAIPDDVGELKRLVSEHDVGAVVIDPLMAHLPEAVNSWRDQSVRRALAPLHHLAEEHSCAIIVVLHLNKARGGDALSRIGGSMGIPAAARSALLLARDPDDPEGEQGSRRVLAHVKCNVGPIAMSLLYEVKPIVIAAAAGEPEVQTAKLEFVGECEHNGHDLLNRDHEEERGALEDAMDFLRDELGNGEWRPSNPTKASARRAGHSPSTLRRARERLGVEVERQGFPGKTMWRLELVSSRAQGDEHDCENAYLEHDWTNPHEQRDSTLFEVPQNPSRAHLADMSTTGDQKALKTAQTELGLVALGDDTYLAGDAPVLTSSRPRPDLVPEVDAGRAHLFDAQFPRRSISVADGALETTGPMDGALEGALETAQTELGLVALGECPYPGGEAALLADLIETFDMTEIET